MSTVVTSRYRLLRLDAIVHPHREGPQRQTEHNASRNQFERIHGLDACKSRPAHYYRERDDT